MDKVLDLTPEQIDILGLLIQSGRTTQDELNTFSQPELQAIAISTREYLMTGESLTLKKIEAQDYLVEVPDAQTFIENTYYLGSELGYMEDRFGKKRRQMYDFWTENFCTIVNDPKITEVAVTGAIGIGKTTFMNALTAWDVAKVLCLKNPQRHYNLMPSTTIVFAFFNILKDLAQDVGYAQFQGMVGGSDFFKKLLYRNIKKKEGFQYGPPLKRRVQFKIGSQVQHSLGIAVFGAQVDEANFGRDTVDPKNEAKKSQVYTNYTSLMRRRESRFLNADGHFIIGSSKKGEADFLEKHIETIKGRPGTYIIDAPQYVVKKCRGEYSGKTFRVLLGDLTREPRILAEEEEVAPELQHLVETVPIEYKNAYEDNIIDALRDISGKAVESKSAFITNRPMLFKMFDSTRATPWNYSSNANTIPNTVRISFAGNDMIQDFLKEEVLFSNKGKLVYPTFPRFIGVDTGYAGDALGIAMVCKIGSRAIVKYNKAYFVPKYWADFVIRVKGLGKDHYPLYKTLEFIKYLVKKGVYVRGVATDGYQSIQMQQDTKLAFPAMDVLQLSTDKDDSLSMQFRNDLYAGCLEGALYEDTNLQVETRDVLHINTGRRGTLDNKIQRKVDHPSIASDKFDGRKDVFDALQDALGICRQLDTGATAEEVQAQINEYNAMDLDKITQDAENAVEQAMKEIENMNLDAIK